MTGHPPAPSSEQSRLSEPSFNDPSSLKQQILTLIRHQGSLSFNEIANSFQVPASQVRQSLADLTQQELITVGADETFVASPQPSPAADADTDPAPLPLDVSNQPPTGLRAAVFSRRLPGRGRGWLLLIGGGMGVVIGLLWWLWGRPPAQPQILEFFPEESDYTAARQDEIQLGWVIEHPEAIRSLKIAGYDPEGKLISGPLTYDFTNGLPADLASVCVESASVLTCNNVATDARQPGDYVFELTLLSAAGAEQQIQRATSSQVTMAALPLPTVAELAPAQVIYAEAGTPAGAMPIPPVGSEGILLSWVVTYPQLIQDLLLIVREADGTVLGGRRFTLRDPNDPAPISLPPELEPFCQLAGALICQGVPSGIGEVGKFTFELAPVVVGQAEAMEGKTSEQVEVLPRPVRITSFRINGNEAQPKYLIPVEPGQPPPPFLLSWQAEGGSTATARLLPSPGTVALSGQAPFPLSPEPGETVLSLEVSNGTSPPLVRSVTIQTFDPTPTPTQPRPTAPAASRPTSRPPAVNPEPAASPAPRLEQPASIAPNPVSPADSPPQFD